MKRAAILLACAAVGLPLTASAHPGGLDAQGCHTNRKTGDRHCHGRSAADGDRPTAATRNLSAPATAFRNCDAARAAGAAPVRRGDPGYGAHLDRDNDGIGCEPFRRP
ncbi:excalibur calcium-binding domain-containing protein [Phenylobacterium terrae]|uniref:Excalibur calcium-binding domain-containing protein n=1 Tax=Phenylobacterium terrae TaxID=2665495 RepID=A0ABW4N415_9CAUL